MVNLLKSIGVLLILAGVSSLLIGILRHLVAALDAFVPNGFKKVLTVQSGALMVLAGLLLLYL